MPMEVEVLFLELNFGLKLESLVDQLCLWAWQVASFVETGAVAATLGLVE